MEEYEDIEQIEAYWNNQLDETERKAFEQRMKDEPAFAEEVNTFKDIITMLDRTDKKQLKDKIKIVDTELENENFFEANPNTAEVVSINTKKNAFRRNLSIAASVLVLLVAGWFIRENNKPPQIAYEMNDNVIDREMKRAGAQGLATSRALLKQGLAKHQEGKFGAAAVDLKEHLDKYPTDKIAQFFVGLNALASSKNKEASTYLVPLSKDKDFKYQEMSKYNLAIAYYKMDTPNAINQAKVLLEEISSDKNSAYAEKAKVLLRKIN